MKHKLFLFLLPVIFILIFLLSIPYYNFFYNKVSSFEDPTKSLTNFDLEEIEKINNIFWQIDDSKITDSNLKSVFSDLKKSFNREEERLVFENKKIEEEKIKKLEFEKQEKQRLEAENKKREEEFEKSIVYPKEFDITNKLANLHIQERNLSCEAAATTDILSTILKTDIKESDILDKMLKDKTYWKASYYTDDWKLIWWDPDNWFVWEMDWFQFKLTWYAIYEKPMSEIYKHYDVNFATYNKFENDLWIKDTKEALSYLLKELVKWNYVQMWWDYCTDQNFEDWNIDRKITTQEALSGMIQKNYCYSFNQERRITWYTEEGKKIEAAKQSHNFVLLWYIWDVENPEKIIIWDTQTWKHIYPTAEWMRKWELNDARAIIVYDKKQEKSENKEEEKNTETIETNVENKEENNKDENADKIIIENKAKRNEEEVKVEDEKN